MKNKNEFNEWADIPYGIILIRMFHVSSGKHILHLHMKVNESPWNEQPKIPHTYSSSIHGFEDFWEWAEVNLPIWNYPHPVSRH